MILSQTKNFRGAPDSAKEMKNPYDGDAAGAEAGKPLYHLRCARCHGENGRGSGNIPPLRADDIRKITPGEMFWFVTKGDPKREMPSWSKTAGRPALEDCQLCEKRLPAKGRSCQRGGLAGAIGGVEPTLAQRAVYRLSLRGAGSGSKNLGERSSQAIYDKVE